MYKVLKEICDDKERVKEHEMEAGRVVQARTPEFLNFCICSVQVRGSARVRGKAAADALQENLKNFSDELQTNAACIGVDGKIKLPKKKKVLTADQECDKLVVAQFKKPEPQNIPSSDA